MLYFKNPGVGECFLIIQVEDLSLIKRLEVNDYVVVRNLDLKSCQWDHGHYFGEGLSAIERSVDFIKKESLR